MPRSPLPKRHPAVAALTQFASREDLTDEARTELAKILAGSFSEFGVTPDGKIALSAAATADLFDVTKDCLTKWRAKDRGPEWVQTCKRGPKSRVLYPVIALRKWLKEVAIANGGRVDRDILAALGGDRREAA